MIHIIQAVRGPYKDSENFETGAKWLIPQPPISNEIPSNVVEDSIQTSSMIKTQRNDDENQLRNKES